MDDLDFGQTVRGLVSDQRVFQRYKLIRLLGRGGMGVVWEAFDEKLERHIALKFLPELLATDPEAANDLKRETRRCLELTHPRIVRIFDFLEDSQQVAISMELIQGLPMSRAKIDRPNGHFEVDELTPILRQLCEALDYAHLQAKVVHRDLKPANLMLTKSGDLKITDFGISATISDTATRVSKSVGSSGTPLYMSPQQMMGANPSPSDDIYSLGALVYELLTGKPPFYTGNILAQVKEAVPVPMSQRRRDLGNAGSPIPEEWERLVAAALSKDPSARPRTGAEVLQLLADPDESATKLFVPASPTTKPARTKSDKSKLPSYSIAASVLLVLGAFGGWYSLIHRPEQQRLAEAEQRRIANELELRRFESLRGTLMVKTKPEGAEIRVGSVAIEKSPAFVKNLRLGKYPVQILQAGYHERKMELEVLDGQVTDPGIIELQPILGSASFSSTPSGLPFAVESTRLVDTTAPAHRAKGITPVALDQLPIGNYQARFSRAPWPDVVKEFSVSAGSLSSLAAFFPESTVSIESNPPGLECILDGMPAGSTPLNLKVPPGTHRVELRREGWPGFTQQFVSEEGKTTRLVPLFSPGSVELTSSPSGAEVLRQGKSVGKTPLLIPDLAPQSVDFEFALPGHLSERTSLRIEAGQKKLYHATLSSMPGIRLSGVSAEQLAKAKISLDGAPTVVSEGRIQTKRLGLQKLRVEYADGGAFESEVSVSRGDNSQVDALPLYTLVRPRWSELKTIRTNLSMQGTGSQNGKPIIHIKQSQFSLEFVQGISRVNLSFTEGSFIDGTKQYKHPLRGMKYEVGFASDGGWHPLSGSFAGDSRAQRAAASYQIESPTIWTSGPYLPDGPVKAGQSWDVEVSRIPHIGISPITGATGTMRGRLLKTQEFLGEQCALIEYDANIKGQLRGDQIMLYGSSPLPSLRGSVSFNGKIRLTRSIRTGLVLQCAIEGGYSRVIRAADSAVYAAVATEDRINYDSLSFNVSDSQ